MWAMSVSTANLISPRPANCTALCVQWLHDGVLGVTLPMTCDIPTDSPQNNWNILWMTAATVCSESHCQIAQTAEAYWTIRVSQTVPSHTLEEASRPCVKEGRSNMHAGLSDAVRRPKQRNLLRFIDLKDIWSILLTVDSFFFPPMW